MIKYDNKRKNTYKNFLINSNRIAYQFYFGMLDTSY